MVLYLSRYRYECHQTALPIKQQTINNNSLIFSHFLLGPNTMNTEYTMRVTKLKYNNKNRIFNATLC